jgi:peptide/nickel transport system ATP-binding protein
VRDLRVEYLTRTGPVCAVGGVSFDIAPGEVLGLAGESGSGKSTLAQAILRLLPAPAAITGGSITLDGEDILGMSEEALRRVRWRKASLVFQSAMNALNPVLTVGEQIVDVILAHERVSRASATDRAASLLARVGIDPDRLGSFPHQLSGGMRQRVVIAIALALSPALLIMDEPTTALDVVVQREVLHQIAELRASLGFAILFITHDLSLMIELSTRIAVLYAGELVEMAPARAIFDHPKHPYTQGLLASFPSLHGPRRRLAGIPGSPPDLQRPPPGCPFNPRCARVVPRCRCERPRPSDVGTDHVAACHLY